MVTTPRAAAIGRPKKANKSPFALIMVVTKFVSTISPSTMPRMAGATGKPFSSINHPTSPIPIMTPTSNTVLLIAKEPTIQAIRTIGKSALWGTESLRIRNSGLELTILIRFVNPASNTPEILKPSKGSNRDGCPREEIG